MQRFIRSFALFSASGFVLSLFVHILGLLNRAPFFGWFALLLHFGVFVAMVGVFVAYFRLRRLEGKGFWKRAFRTSPTWMRWTFLLLFIYAIVNFLSVWNKLFELNGKSLDEVMVIMLRGFSGHWLLFYFATFAAFYSAMRATQQTIVSKT